MNGTDKVKIAMRWIFAIWFSVLSIFVGISSFEVYRTAGDEKSTNRFESIKLPIPPNPPVLEDISTLNVEEQVKISQQRISAYEKQVSAYEKQIIAYKTQMELADKSDTLARYKAVVTDTLVVYLSGFVTAFLGWIFANLAAGAAERFTESRQRHTEAADSVNNQPLKPIKIL